MDHFHLRSQNPDSSSTTSSFSSSFHGHNSKTENTKRSRSTSTLSTDPQSVAARERRHRISDRFKILQSMVPGGEKMDTVSMLDEAIRYVKFLKAQIWFHQNMLDLFLNDNEVTSSCSYSPAAGEFGPRLFGYDGDYAPVKETDSQDMSLTVMDSEYPPLFGSVGYEQERRSC